MSSDFEFDLTDEVSRETTAADLDYDYTLSENVVYDLVKYTRSRTVKNEQQFMLTTLGYVSGFMETPKHFISGVLIGTAGSGKSHLQNTVQELFPNSYLYQTTTGSETSIIYDDTWEDAFIASLDELQKPSDEIIELLKSLHGGEDTQFRYKVTGGGEGADRDVDEIVRSAIPYWFLYAQYEPDFEMWDRLLKVPVHESKDKNEGVARSQWDHSLVSFGGDIDYLYDFEDGRLALKDHLREVPKDSWVKIPAGEEEFGWDAFEHARHIFDIGRSETNRVSSQIANLVRASALLNHEQREVRQINVRNEGTKEAIVAQPQDLANVLACRDVLLATTHQLDRKRKAICLAIQQAGGTQQAASIPDIQSYLRKTNASFVERSQVEAMLHDLQDNYLVEKLEGAGENGRNLYQFQSWQSLGKFEINDEFKRVFSECHDPFSGNDFVETAREINEQLTPSVSDFTSDAEVTSDSEEAQATLTSGEQQQVEVDLEPHEQRVAELLHENLDGEIITDLDDHDPSVRELLGLVPMGEPDDDVDVTDTVLDPGHEVWYHGPDEWVESVNDAEQEVEKAIRTLTMEGVFDTSTLKSRGGEPLEMKVSVKEV